ncbi:MAG: hypothetical protein LKF31_08925 [Muribaculaceae bacterium]|nr:hypothetical protein [Muribaculaceae bacterium]
MSLKQHLLPLFTVMMLLAVFGSVSAKGIFYSAVARMSDGYVASKSAISITAEILDKTNSKSPIYSESHDAVTDSLGRFSVYIGKGNVISGKWDSINWSTQKFLRISSMVNGKSHVSLGVVSINGAPKSLAASTTDTLYNYSPDGTKWLLTVNDVGDLAWKKTASSDSDTTVVYPQSKWPDKLYLVGNINSWDPTTAEAFTRAANGIFVMDRQLTTGNVIKFIKVQSWNGDLDWSGTSGDVNVAAPLKEWGNTPEFQGDTGTYHILVDFTKYTLTITKKN